MPLSAVAEEGVGEGSSWHCWMRRYQSCGTNGNAKIDDNVNVNDDEEEEESGG